MSIRQVAGVTDTGRKRRRNEDSYVLAPPLFAIADGMGGAQAGEVASRLAAAALEDTDHGALRGEAGLAALIQEANRRVYERSHADPSASGMGTTMTVALVEHADVAFGHVGDSRAYRARDGRLEQLTEDHSLVNELVKSGKLSPEEAESHPQRSVITRAVGTDPSVDVDTFSVEARPGDVFLLCSDGLTDMVGDAEILATIERHRDDLDRAARELVKAANRGGGDDNITVVAFEILDAAAGDPEQTVRMRAAGAGDVPADEEDTLDGLPAVGAGDTMVVPAGEVEVAFGLVQDGDEAAAGESAPPPRRRRRLLPALGLLVLIAAAAVVVAWTLLR